MEGTESKLEFKDIVKKQWILKQLESIGKFVLKKYCKKVIVNTYLQSFGKLNLIWYYIIHAIPFYKKRS